MGEQITKVVTLEVTYDPEEVRWLDWEGLGRDYGIKIKVKKQEVK